MKLSEGAESQAHGQAGAPGTWLVFLLLWLCGACLRFTVLAVPPLLPAIHRDLQLSETAVGTLTSLPVLLLAGAAVPGSLLVSWIGARSALLLGLSLVAGAGALRGAGTSTALILGMTFLMGVGVAVAQLALPSLVQQWVPRWIGRATASYANGLLIGEIAAVSLTSPVVMPLVGYNWRGALAVWSIPEVFAVVGVVLLTTHRARARGTPPERWWPDWRSARTWRLGLILGCASSAYFSTNAFVPDYLKITHHASQITPALTCLNLGQLPASFVVMFFAPRLIGRRLPLVAAGLMIAGALAGFLAWNGPLQLACITVLGFWCALVLTTMLALPPFLAEARDLHRLVAAMFTISYGSAFASSLLGGAIWDLTAAPFTAFAPVFVAAVGLTALAAGLRIPSQADPGIRGSSSGT